MEDNLEQVKENMFKIQDVVKLQDIAKDDRVMPFLDTKIWYRDFYDMLWSDQLSDDMYLIIEVIENDETYPTGATALKVNNEDGSLKYGSYELPIYQYPLKDFTQPELNQSLGYTILFILNEPKPMVDQSPEEVKKNQQIGKPPIEETKKPDSEEEKKEISPRDLEK